MIKQCPGCKTSFIHDENLIIPNFGMSRYGVASAECQATFNEILAKEQMHYGYPPAHRLIVDAYAVQHPPVYEYQRALGIEKRLIEASKQSIARHLIMLFASLEEKIELPKIAAMLDAILITMNKQGKTLPTLTPPQNLGTLTAYDVNKLINDDMSLEEYTQLAWQWAHAAYDAWQEHHETIKKLCKEYTK